MGQESNKGSVMVSTCGAVADSPDPGGAMPSKSEVVHDLADGVSPARAPARREAAVLTGKLIPPDVAPATVLRARLITALTRAVQRSAVTLLSGPAGSGKTTLAACWVHAQPGGVPIGWITLDAYDDDPATFWTYVLEALDDAGVDIDGVSSPVPGEALHPSVIPGLALAVLAHPRTRPVVLIIDQADYLWNPLIMTGLDLLLRNAGHRLHLVLCGRADPGLPLHKYRLEGSIAEIRSAQLAFTPDETRELFHAAGVRVSAPVAQALCEQAEGWAVGLRLAVAPLKQGTDPEQLVTSLAHDDGSVAQYLFAEVLEDQPASVRRFLMRISVTAELWPELVSRLSGRPNGSRILAGLARGNAFVEQSPGAPGGYRIHPLFREMLQAQLGFTAPHELARLHRLAAAWFAETGHAIDGLRHAIAAEDWSFATSLLVDEMLVGRLLAGTAEFTLQGLDAVPPNLPGAEAAVVRAATAISARHAPIASDLATVAAASLDPANRLRLRAAAALTSVAADPLPDADTVGSGPTLDDAGALVGALPADQASSAILGVGRAVGALSGDAPTAEIVASLRAAAAASASLGSRRLSGIVLGGLALLEACEGRLSRAEQFAGEAENAAATRGVAEHDRSATVSAALAWVALDRWEVDAARDWLARARERSAESPFIVAVLATQQSRLLRLRHEHDLADAALRVHLDDRRLPHWVRELVVTEAVRTQFAHGRIDDGLALLDGLDDGNRWEDILRATAGVLGGPDADPPSDAGERTPPVLVVESAIVRACRDLQDGTVPLAVTELRRALDVAGRETLRWPFFDAPAPARRLLRMHPQLQGPTAWLSPSSGPVAVRRPSSGAGKAQPEEAPLVTQALSERELEVLQQLAGMLSTAEIAATMFISVNTVRTHIRSILRKLSATRRNQAVRRAREAGII
jgi:LuxR family maltose regulon positive regulatory protein